MDIRRAVKLHSRITIGLALLFIVMSIYAQSQSDNSQYESGVLGWILLVPVAVAFSAVLYALPMLAGILVLHRAIKNWAVWPRVYYGLYLGMFIGLMVFVAMSYTDSDAGLGVLASPFICIPAALVTYIAYQITKANAASERSEK